MSCFPAAIMIRSASLVPTSRPPSWTSIVTGAFTASQPEIGPGAAAETGASTDEVTPAWLMTRCLTAGPPWACSTTSCSPGARFATFAGAVPYSVPSTVTFAPGGSDCTSRLPADGVSGSSRYCVASAPAATVTGITRGTPRPRSSIECDPGLSEARTGVLPLASPSINTWTPGGFVCTESDPSVGAVGFLNARPAITTPSASATIASAATATRRQLPNRARAGAGAGSSSSGSAFASGVAAAGGRSKPRSSSVMSRGSGFFALNVGASTLPAVAREGSALIFDEAAAGGCSLLAGRFHMNGSSVGGAVTTGGSIAGFPLLTGGSTPAFGSFSTNGSNSGLCVLTTGSLDFDFDPLLSGEYKIERVLGSMGSKLIFGVLAAGASKPAPDLGTTGAGGVVGTTGVDANGVGITGANDTSGMRVELTEIGGGSTTERVELTGIGGGSTTERVALG